MQRYETLLLTVPEITNDESEHLEKDIAKLVKDSAGELISYERWGKFRLAYPVRKNEYGVYYLARFEVEGEKASSLVQGIRNFFKVKRHDLVMRSMTSVLEPHASLVYQRPQSLEEVPTRSRDTMQYLKEARAISAEAPRGGGKPARNVEKLPEEEIEVVEETQAQE